MKRPMSGAIDFVKGRLIHSVLLFFKISLRTPVLLPRVTLDGDCKSDIRSRREGWGLHALVRRFSTAWDPLNFGKRLSWIFVSPDSKHQQFLRLSRWVCDRTITGIRTFVDVLDLTFKKWAFKKQMQTKFIHRSCTVRTSEKSRLPPNSFHVVIRDHWRSRTDIVLRPIAILFRTYNQGSIRSENHFLGIKESKRPLEDVGWGKKSSAISTCALFDQGSEWSGNIRIGAGTDCSLGQLRSQFHLNYLAWQVVLMVIRYWRFRTTAGRCRWEKPIHPRMWKGNSDMQPWCWLAQRIQGRHKAWIQWHQWNSKLSNETRWKQVYNSKRETTYLQPATQEIMDLVNTISSAFQARVVICGSTEIRYLWTNLIETGAHELITNPIPPTTCGVQKTPSKTPVLVSMALWIEGSAVNLRIQRTKWAKVCGSRW